MDKIVLVIDDLLPLLDGIEDGFDPRKTFRRDVTVITHCVKVSSGPAGSIPDLSSVAEAILKDRSDRL
ncbi:MAG: hypothetical protein IPJ40_24345 [Saprospirales bacterium]|nr:hypothetical protein [Saprospirales bacterium]